MPELVFPKRIRSAVLSTLLVCFMVLASIPLHAKETDSWPQHPISRKEVAKALYEYTFGSKSKNDDDLEMVQDEMGHFYTKGGSPNPDTGFRSIDTGLLKGGMLITGCAQSECDSERRAILLDNKKHILAAALVSPACDRLDNGDDCKKPVTVATVCRPSYRPFDEKRLAAEREVVLWIWSNEYADPPIKINELTFDRLCTWF